MYKSIISFAALGFFSLARAQSSVPSDLSPSFDPNSITLQVSYDDQSDNGFKDGSQFTNQQTSKTPTFALGDASGVNTALTMMVMMIDTTDDNQRVLHFLQPGFKATEDKTAIASTSQPLQAYQAPGTMGDSGLRKYSFLLYSQPSKGLSTSNMPSPGSAFNVEDFQSQNNLQPAMAGIGMQVQIAGGSTGSQTTQPPAPAASTQSSLGPPPVFASGTASLIQSESPAPLASVSTAVTPPVLSATAVPSLLTSLVSFASVEASSAVASGSAVVMSLTSSAAAAASTGISNATAPVTAASATANTVPSATSSAAATQSSSNALALRADVLFALPWFIFTGVILG